MKGILTGSCHKRGVFTDDNGEVINYDNLVLFLQTEITNSDDESRYCEGDGTCEVIAKTPWDNLANVFNNAISSREDLKKYYGSEVNYYFNNKNKLDLVIL